jgi:hypothetical protein
MDEHTHKIVNGERIELTPEEILQIKQNYENNAERRLRLKWNTARVQRNSLLQQSDLLVLPDLWASYTTEKQTAISTYRQALRDLPENQTDPDNIVWPTLPN